VSPSSVNPLTWKHVGPQVLEYSQAPPQLPCLQQNPGGSGLLPEAKTMTLIASHHSATTSTRTGFTVPFLSPYGKFRLPLVSHVSLFPFL
jgi:hypothetical protein